MLDPLVVRRKSAHSTGHLGALNCPHCKVGGNLVLGRYVTVSLMYDVAEGCWHCLICGFIGFGSNAELLQYRLVACLGGSPRLPGQRARAKRKPQQEE